MGWGRAGPVALWGCGMDEECALQQDGAGMLPVPPLVPGLLQGNNPGKHPVLCQLLSQGVPGMGFPTGKQQKEPSGF